MENVITDFNTISKFLAGIQADTYGRFFGDILLWDDDQLEKCHDQIQWTFPLHEESNFAQTYPIITPAFIEKAIENDILWEMIKSNMRLMTSRMANFYGFNLPPLKQRDFYCKRTDWMKCNPPDHNLLRITRIIRSLRLFGLDSLANEFNARAENKVLMYINQYEEWEWKKTLSFWQKALNNNIWETLR